MEQGLESSRPVVVKPNFMLNASFTLPVQEQRLLHAAVSRINPCDARGPNETIPVDMHDYWKACPEGTKPTYRDVRKAVVDLFNRKISYTFQDEHGHHHVWMARWVQELSYKTGEGIFFIRLSDPIFELLTEIRNKYLSYDLEQIRNFKNRYTVRFYEWFKKHHDLNGEAPLVLDVDEIRRRTETEHTLQQMVNFRNRIINPAIMEVNKFTEYRVKVKPIKEGVKYKAFSFKVVRK